MRSAKPAARPRKAEPPPQTNGLQGWHLALALLLLVFAAFTAYGPAIKGPFLFDDWGLPYYLPEFQDKPLSIWTATVRPLLMASYYVNFSLAGRQTFWFHVTNVLIHIANTVLVFLVILRLLRFLKRTDVRDRILAAAGAGIFLLHPLATESVAYVAGRSESLSAFFMLAAYTLFLYHSGGPIAWWRTVAILFSFGCALAVKEHTAILPALLLLTDLYFRSGPLLDRVRDHLRLYILLAVGALAGVVQAVRIISQSISVGAAASGVTWYEYLWNQFRVFWIYMRLYFFPVGLNADYQLAPERSFFSPSIWTGLAAFAALLFFGWKYRKRFPLAWFGLLVVLLLLAPTSSFIPIKDLIVERRMYLPLIGMVLITIEFLRRWSPPQTVMAGLILLFVLGGLTYARAGVWSSGIALWEDTLSKSPRNFRGYAHLVYGYLREGRCAAVLQRLERLPPYIQPDVPLLVSWAHAYNCANRPSDALTKLQAAAAIGPTPGIYALIAEAQRKLGQTEESKASLEEAARLQSGESARARSQESPTPPHDKK